MSAWLRLIVATAAVAPAVAASPAPAAVRNATLQMVDARSATVDVPFRRNKSTRVANVSVLVRNRVSATRILRIRYVPANPTAGFDVKAVARTAGGKRDGPLTRREGLLIPIAANDLADLQITFTGRITDATPERADGRLVLVSERRSGARVAGAPLVLRFRGVRSEERLVRSAPKVVKLPVKLAVPELHWPITGLDISNPRLGDIAWHSPIELRDPEHGRASAELRGPGAADLVNRTDTAVLRQEDGTTIDVPVAIARRGDNLTTVRIGQYPLEIDSPGRYNGTLPLGPGASAPTVGLRVAAKLWWGWAALAVVFGVLIGRLIPPLLRERLRRRGRRAIKDAIRQYARARRRRRDPAAYDLDHLIAPDRWRLSGVLRRPADEPARLFRALDEQDDETDLRATVQSGMTLLGRVELWTQAENSAQRLTEALDRAESEPRFFPLDNPAQQTLFARSADSGPKQPMQKQWVILALALVTTAIVVVAFGIGLAVGVLVLLAAVLLSAGLAATRRPAAAGRKRRRFSSAVVADAEAIRDALRSEPKIAERGRLTAPELATLTEKCVRADREVRVVELAREIWQREARLEGKRPSDDRSDALQAIWKQVTRHPKARANAPIQADAAKRSAPGFPRSYASCGPRTETSATRSEGIRAAIPGGRPSPPDSSPSPGGSARRRAVLREAHPRSSGRYSRCPLRSGGEPPPLRVAGSPRRRVCRPCSS